MVRRRLKEVRGHKPLGRWLVEVPKTAEASQVGVRRRWLLPTRVLEVVLEGLHLRLEECPILRILPGLLRLLRRRLSTAPLLQGTRNTRNGEGNMLQNLRLLLLRLLLLKMLLRLWLRLRPMLRLRLKLRLRLMLLLLRGRRRLQLRSRSQSLRLRSRSRSSKLPLMDLLTLVLEDLLLLGLLLLDLLLLQRLLSESSGLSPDPLRNDLTDG